jgi:N-acyl-D-aspartate/D-glutamate deacylase
MRFFVLVLAAPLMAQQYDVVFNNGRVIDPESKLDAIRSVGIKKGKIAEISSHTLAGRTEINAQGLVVSPGFIDLHSHGQTPENYGFKARDGVTTALELEVGVSPVPRWYAARQGKALINFGASSGHIPARIAVMHDSGTLLPRDAAVNHAATSKEQQQIYSRVRQGLEDGALGIGLGIAYVPKATRAEIFGLFQLAAEYKVGMTDLSSAIFDEGWQARQGGISYGDLQWAATGERLTAESFARYRKQGGMVAIHSIPEEIVRLAVADPTVMIASDGILDKGKGHPRAAGTYGRVLGRYVREEHALSLSDAIRKMSLMPAQRLGLSNKGRIRVGADADITAFDPDRVIDRATFDKPAQYSEGIPFVLVGGTLVVKDSQIQTGAFPGTAILLPKRHNVPASREARH